MAKKSKIRVMQSFVYKGKDGLLPNKKWITISPGEECPSLDSNEKERLIKEQVICETDMYGENIVSKKLVTMNAEEIDRLFNSKNPQTLSGIISSTDFTQETLARMLVYSEKSKLPGIIIQAINQKLEG
jgi:hypothetical protein